MDGAACFADRLTARLAQTLPGRDAQSPFAPQFSFGRHGGPPPHDARHAAVLALLFSSDDSWSIPLTLRPDHLDAHASQVCFPGGTMDPGESCEQAALRELHEELGILSHQVRVAGCLSPLYVFASNFWVTPIVGIAEQPVRFEPNPAEVAEVVILPTRQLLDQKCRGSDRMGPGPVRFLAPHIICGTHRVWGATSMILGELSVVLQDVEKPDEVRHAPSDPAPPFQRPK